MEGFLESISITYIFVITTIFSKAETLKILFKNVFHQSYKACNILMQLWKNAESLVMHYW